MAYYHDVANILRVINIVIPIIATSLPRRAQPVIWTQQVNIMSIMSTPWDMTILLLYRMTYCVVWKCDVWSRGLCGTSERRLIRNVSGFVFKRISIYNKKSRSLKYKPIRITEISRTENNPFLYCWYKQFELFQRNALYKYLLLLLFIR